MNNEWTPPDALKGKKVSIVIPALENLDLTRNCWRSIQKNTAVDYEIILVDNGSKEPLSQDAASEGIYCIRNERNLGFAAAVNQGLRAAQGDFMVVLNNDTLVTPKWMQRLLEHFAASPGLGMLAPVTNYANNAIQRIDSKYNDETTLYQFSEKRYESYRGQCIDQNKVAGVCMVIPKIVVEAVGLFDTRFGIGNFEDDDYCLRVRRAGYRVAIANDVFIHHEGGRTFQLLDIDYAALLEQNSKLFLEKWAPVLGVQGAARAGADLGQSGALRSGVTSILLQDEQSLSIEALESILETLPEASSVRLVCEKSGVASQCDQAGIAVLRAARQDLLRVVDRQIRACGTTHALIVSSRLIAQAGWVESLLDGSADAKLVLLQVGGGSSEPAAAAASQGVAVLVDTAAYGEAGGLSPVFTSAVSWEELALRMEDAGMKVEWAASKTLALRALEPTACHVDATEHQLVESLVSIQRCVVDGDIDKALAGLQEVIAKKADFVQAHEWKGILHTTREEWASAQAAFERVVELYPEHPSAHNSLGWLAYETGEQSIAAVHFEEALRLQPDHLDAARNLAHLSFESGNPQRALDLYLGIVQKAPDDPQSYIELGSWYERLGEAGGAADWYRQALQVAPDCQEARDRLQAIESGEPIAGAAAVAQP